MKQNQAIEVVSYKDQSDDLSLCGIADLEKASYNYSAAIYHNNITEENLVSNIIGLGEENKFFYILESYIDNTIVKYEHGLGYAYESDGNFYFKRFLQLYDGSCYEKRNPSYIQSPRFSYEHNSVNVLRSTLPEHYFLSLYDDNCVLISTGPFIASSIKLKENSFLARVDDNDISSLSFDDKAFANIIAEALAKHTKQLSLKASKLSVGKLSAKHLQLEPSSDLNVKKGTFIYDETTDSIKFYNGEKWRTLKWVDEESE